MHGVIFASLTDYIGARFDAEAATAILGGEPPYRMSETYEDERLLALIDRTVATTGVAREELVHDFGVFTAETTFARLYPAYFAVAGSTTPFLLTIEDRIHELVRATIPNARPPRLRVTELGPDSVQIEYSSPRRLCVLLTGLVRGTAAHYGQEVEIDQSSCMLRGDPACLVEVRVSAAPPTAA